MRQKSPSKCRQAVFLQRVIGMLFIVSLITEWKISIPLTIVTEQLTAILMELTQNNMDSPENITDTDESQEVNDSLH